jgi:hypothetical protein
MHVFPKIRSLFLVTETVKVPTNYHVDLFSSMARTRRFKHKQFLCNYHQAHLPVKQLGSQLQINDTF